ncbi:hypothetical protein ECE50_004980 [Chitinophaga sp. Mgbs1]|uniref:Uncharacterized protein n=1 Tax=Chitinophaga solisilvae TaxID=1233460 RepID=A0A3S1AYW5_9BACT|nr:hypothetical protein [Chitinophaga solisilvae]
MNTKTLRLNFFTVTIGIIFAALSRLLPHPPNFAPMMAIGIFGGALFVKRIWAPVISLISVWISDLLINNILYSEYFDHFVWFYDGWYWQYVIYALVPFICSWLFGKTIRVSGIAAACIGSGIMFFGISNFGVWVSSDMYPRTADGLLSCYVMALPYLKGTILSNLFYTAILFGAYFLVERKMSLAFINFRYTWKWI